MNESWRDEAACATTSPEIFFGDDGMFSGDAKRICGGCDVINECLIFALAGREEHGVWGGLTTPERRRLLRKKAA